MSRFTKTVKFEQTFDGDKVTFELRRLTRRHMALLTPLIQRGRELAREQGPDVKLGPADLQDLSEQAAIILPECVVTMTGLRDAEGVAMQLSDIIEPHYFTPLLVGALTHLIKESSFGDAVAKKSAPAPSDSSPATGSENPSTSPA